MSDDQPKCPVDPKSRNIWLQKSKQSQQAQQKTINDELNLQTNLQSNIPSWSWKNLIWSSIPNPNQETPAAAVCPIPHDSNAKIPSAHPHIAGMIITNEPEAIECSSSQMDQSLLTPTSSTFGSSELSQDRVISSIPRTNVDSNWIYPSEKQFFNAMLRKNWNPEENDMKTVVPLHNLVNEVTWKYILNWEKDIKGNKLGDIKLTSFKGDASKLTPRAFIGHYIFGRDLPFDRHDWIVNRNGLEIEYVIDFYTTQPINEGDEPKFYLDVRPKLNSFEGCKMRLYRALGL